MSSLPSSTSSKKSYVDNNAHNDNSLENTLPCTRVEILKHYVPQFK